MGISCRCRIWDTCLLNAYRNSKTWQSNVHKVVSSSKSAMYRWSLLSNDVLALSLTSTGSDFKFELFHADQDSASRRMKARPHRYRPTQIAHAQSYYPLARYHPVSNTTRSIPKPTMQTSATSNRKRSHWSLEVDEERLSQSTIKRTCIELPRGGSYDSTSDNGERIYKSIPRRSHPVAYAPPAIGNGIVSPLSTSSSSSSSSSPSYDSNGESESESEPREDLNSDRESESSSSTSESESSFRSRSASTSSRLSNDRTTPRIPTLTALPRPQIRDLQSVAPEASALQSRLSTFLPSLAAANQELEYERREGRLGERDIENLGTDGEGAYIQMVCPLTCSFIAALPLNHRSKTEIIQDLGLGVLEEKHTQDFDNESVSSTSSSSSSSSSSDSAMEQGDTSKEARGKEKDVLRKLMGRDRNKDRPIIQVVDC